MMIQSSNPLSVLSGSEGGGAVQQGLLAEGGNAEAFTNSLIQQLALLQGNLAKNANVDAGVLADLQAKAGALDGHAVGQEVQDFAALFGKTLPTAKKVGQDIDLDDTLNALADVLQHLQGLGTDSTSPSVDLSQAMDAMKQVEPALPIDPATQADAQSDAVAIAAAVSAAMQAPQQPVQQVMPEPASAEVSVQMPSAVIGDDALLALKKNMQPGNAVGNKESFAAAQTGSDKQPFALGGEMAGATLTQDNTSQFAGQDKQSAPDNAVDELAALASQAKTIETDKNASRMASDIAQLNQAVKAEKTVEVPAMSRHLGHPEWNKELGEKLIWMHKQDIPSAELRLNPQHLGPISIKVDVNQDQATVAFTAQNAAVKEAIEAALPKLREMLGGQQLNLVDVNVSQQQSEQRQPSDFFKMASERGNGGNGQNDETANPATQATVDIVEEIETGRALASNGLLSLFA